MPDGFAKTPEPPYYVVIFTAQRTEVEQGYAAMSDAMRHLVTKQPGFLGMESVRSASGLGITAAYFRDEVAVAAWRNNTAHMEAQRLGQERWYSHYEVRVAKVERAYAGPEGR